MKSPVASTVALFSLSLAAGAATLVNGSFEDLDASYVDEPDWDLMSGTVATNWSTFNTSDWGLSAGSGDLYSTPYGDHFSLSAATGTFDTGVYREGVTQVISDFVIGDTYEISFSHANGLRYNPQVLAYEGVGTTGGWQVFVDSTSLGLFASTNDNSTPTLAWTSAWQSSSVTFTATDTSHDLRFIAYKPDGIQIPTFQFIDNAHVQLVPEPSAGLLGWLGGSFLLRRRRA